MAKYEVTYKCGCTHTVTLYGKYEDREKRIGWLATQECDECRKTRLNALAKDKAESRGLPLLIGSDKQIIWANSIREKFASYNDQINEVYKYGKERAGLSSEQLNTLESILNELREAAVGDLSNTSATYWIDRRCIEIEAEAKTLNLNWRALLDQIHKSN